MVEGRNRERPILLSSPPHHPQHPNYNTTQRRYTNTISIPKLPTATNQPPPKSFTTIVLRSKNVGATLPHPLNQIAPQTFHEAHLVSSAKPARQVS